LPLVVKGLRKIRREHSLDSWIYLDKKDEGKGHRRISILKNEQLIYSGFIFS